MTDYSGNIDFRLGGKFIGESFHNFYEWLDDLIQAELLVYPDEKLTIVYERPGSRPHWHTLRIAHGMAGIVEMLEGKYSKQGVVSTNVPPKGIKLFFTGTGSADKELMTTVAREVYPECSGHDEADAIALYHYWQEVYNNAK
jgi:hypothetical protein